MRDCVSKGEAESYKERNPTLACGELHAYTHIHEHIYMYTHDFCIYVSHTYDGCHTDKALLLSQNSNSEK